jgi:hypothetical protein
LLKPPSASCAIPSSHALITEPANRATVEKHIVQKYPKLAMLTDSDEDCQRLVARARIIEYATILKKRRNKNTSIENKSDGIQSIAFNVPM